MQKLFYLILSAAVLATASFAADAEIKPIFTFNWDEKTAAFTLTGTVEFPRTVTVADAFLKNFLSEQAVMSVIHSSSGVKTLKQSFNGTKEPLDLPEVGKVVSFSVTGEKCKFIICAEGTMESNCKMTQITAKLSAIECIGIPNKNMKSHSTKITCSGGTETNTKCNFELKGQPGSRRYALGGSAESLFSFYGLVYRSVNNGFNEIAFKTTRAPQSINSFYTEMIDNEAKSYSSK